MILQNSNYVPVLRWRQGEYQALIHLADPVKDQIVPFITIPDVEYDFEDKKPKKTVGKHIEPFVRRYESKWGVRPSWIGLHGNIAQHPMPDGCHVFTYIFDGLSKFGSNAVPAIPIDVDRNTIQAVSTILRRDARGVAISVRLEDLMNPDLGADVRAVASKLGVGLENIDFTVDLEAPNFEPYETFSTALIGSLRRLDDLHIYRNFVLVASAIPETFKDIPKGASEIPRHDWLFYQTLTSKLPIWMRRPNFGDYTITHPKFAAFDMRIIKPVGKILYTTATNWSVRKGGSFRDNPYQMYAHCADIVEKKFFRGSAFSEGDGYIARCAAFQEQPTNLTRWKGVGVNHHITHVSDDLAKFAGVP